MVNDSSIISIKKLLLTEHCLKYVILYGGDYNGRFNCQFISERFFKRE